MTQDHNTGCTPYLSKHEAISTAGCLFSEVQIYVDNLDVKLLTSMDVNLKVTDSIVFVLTGVVVTGDKPVTFNPRDLTGTPTAHRLESGF